MWKKPPTIIQPVFQEKKTPPTLVIIVFFIILGYGDVAQFACIMQKVQNQARKFQMHASSS